MLLPVGDDNSARRTVPYVTYLLVLVNVIFFIVELARGEDFIVQWSFVPQRFLDNPAGEFPTLFTSMFMHGGWFHIVGNMLYLWIFADNVEDNFGHYRFLAFYLVCGLAGTFAQMAVSPDSEIPSLGASGAIAGALGAYVLLFPRGRVKVLLGLLVIPLPAFLVLGLWIFLQLFSGIGSIVSPGDEGGVAYMAHIGGFAAGFILAFFLRRRRERAPFDRGGWDRS
jgi:membrane associated rhomboid family serine protease